MVKLDVQQDVPLAPLTTLGLGGPARHFIRVRTEESLVEAFRWAREEGVPVQVLAGGSNVVVADAGYPGLIIHNQLLGCSVAKDGVVRVAAGEPWDDVVHKTVSADLAGLECLSGIPGSTGATPIQNVGAYGQQVADTLQSVRVLTRDQLEPVEFGPDDCEFAYRDSLFKRRPDRWVVLEVTFGLRPGGKAKVEYDELAGTLGSSPSLAETRQAVLALRRSKSMVLDPDDPNRRSVGSFFLNPIVTDELANQVVQTALADGLVNDAAAVPRFSVGGGKSKLAAAWLIERTGFHKGFVRGAVGISSKHALALVHHGGGTTAQLLSLADEIRDRVKSRFGVTLYREPRLLG